MNNQDNKILNVTIVGERCSGTNWIENLVTQNFNVKLIHPMGWKHAPNFQDTPRSAAAKQTTLIIFVVRNVFDWIRSFHKSPHHVRERRGSLERFVELSPWRSVKEETGRLLSTDSDLTSNASEPVFYADLLDMRSRKHMYWRKQSEGWPNVLWVRYEDVLAQPEHFLENIRSRYAWQPVAKNVHRAEQDECTYNVLSDIYKSPMQSQEKSFDASIHCAKQFWNCGGEAVTRWFHENVKNTDLLQRILNRVCSDVFEKDMRYDAFYNDIFLCLSRKKQQLRA